MSLMVTNGSEMIRYNPSSSSIEYSNTRGVLMDDALQMFEYG